ncbi:hypothetical protein MATL_G00100590 [Megalops atlanticus]|uniref:Uncharacterized protein n=1 Tax=Megalops atlanticus TaxID=7932 RepID=A0A9D3Q758_MEGAT|nr:hypothetical protein MATL_G00100590 [Megalops atlanticus]
MLKAIVNSDSQWKSVEFQTLTSIAWKAVEAHCKPNNLGGCSERHTVKAADEEATSMARSNLLGIGLIVGGPDDKAGRA